MNQPSGSILKPSVQHAPFNVNAARQLQIEARFEQCRRQSPTPKNLLPRLQGQFARRPDLPKSCQTLDPVQSASEQLRTSIPVESPPTVPSSDPKPGLRGLRTPNLKSSLQAFPRPPLSASKPAVSLESVIFQRQRDREENIAATKVAALVLQQSRSPNSPFTPNSISAATPPSISINSVAGGNPQLRNYENDRMKSSPYLGSNTPSSQWLNRKPILDDSDSALLAASSDEQHQIVLRSPLPMHEASSSNAAAASPKEKVPSPLIGNSFSEPHLSSPIPQGTSLMDFDSDFVPEKFPETPSDRSTRHVLPTSRSSRVVEAFRPPTDSVRNDSLRTLMAMISKKSSHDSPAESLRKTHLSNEKDRSDCVASDARTNNNQQPVIATKESTVAFEMSSPSIVANPDTSCTDRSLSPSNSFQNMLEDISKDQFDHLFLDRSADNNSTRAISLDLPNSPGKERHGEDDASKIAQSGEEIAASTDILPSPSNLLLQRTDSESKENALQAEAVMPSATQPIQGSPQVSVIDQEELLTAELALKSSENRSLCNSSATPSKVALSPDSSYSRDNISRQIITPKRSISLRKSSSPVFTPTLLAQDDRGVHARTEHSEPTENLSEPVSRKQKLHSPDDSVRSIDGSTSNRSVSGLSHLRTGSKEEESDDYVCLEKWYLDWQDKSFSIFGVDSKTELKSGGKIIHRDDPSHIVLAGGKRVLLGEMETETMQNVFGEKLTEIFHGGFPDDWLDLITSFKPDQETAAGPRTKIDRSSTAVSSNSKTTSKPRGRPRSAKKISNYYSKSSPKATSEVTPTTKTAVIMNKKSRSRKSSGTAVNSDKSTAPTSVASKTTKKQSPQTRKRQRVETKSEPKQRISNDSNLLTEVPLDSVEGVTFSHTGRMRVQPLKFWLTERIIAETGTICTVNNGSDPPPAPRPRKRSLPAKSKASPAKRARNPSRRKRRSI